jgi:hypothetical protein
MCPLKLVTIADLSSVLIEEDSSSQEDKEGDLKSDLDEGSLGTKSKEGVAEFGNAEQSCLTLKSVTCIPLPK